MLALTIWETQDFDQGTIKVKLRNPGNRYLYRIWIKYEVTNLVEIQISCINYAQRS